MVLLGPRETRVSKKGMNYCLWDFCGELDVGGKRVDVLEQLVTMLACWMMKILSTYLSKNLGGCGVELMSFGSNSFMNRFAIEGLMGESMAV